MTNSATPKAANLPELSNIPVPVDFSQPTGLALMLADMIVSGRKAVSYLRQISAADFTSGEYTFPTPADYDPAPYQLPMLEPSTWNVVADIITAYQPVEVYQIGSSTDLIQSTFPIIINPTDYANQAEGGAPIKPLAEGQSVILRFYKVASAGINWTGSNVVNNGLTDEAIRSLTQITMVVTNIAGAYTVTDWLGVNFLTNGMSGLKTLAKGNFAAVVNELYDAITNKTAEGPAGGDLAGTYPNPTIGAGKVTTDKIAAGAVTAAKIAADVKLPTPEALTFTGGVSGTFDGTEAKTIPVPYEWAQAEAKPEYTAAEVGALPETNPRVSGDLFLTNDGIQNYESDSVYFRWLWRDISNGVATTSLRGYSGVGAKDWRLRLSDNGYAYWGNITQRNGTFMTGYVYALNGFYQDSDERLKTFLGDLRVDWAAIKALPKQYYRFKKGDTEKIHIGTSAQALRQSYPELVSEDADGMLSVDYTKLSIVALAAVCELEERITKIEKLISNHYGSI